MKTPEISIIALGSVSPLGFGTTLSWPAYRDAGHRLDRSRIGPEEEWVGRLPAGAEERVASLAASRPEYEDLDRSVLFAILASRLAFSEAGWDSDDPVGINIGSSRGATGRLERIFSGFAETGRVPALASPVTTLGNVSSWVAQDLGSDGPEFSHSITCSTALHALLNGIAWLRSSMAERFLCGGSEAPLTAFTVAQMQALKIYSRESDGYPCRSLDPDKRNNSMVLGEGAASVCLERGRSERALALVRGVGYATEPLRHAVSLSADAKCIQRSMRRALGSLPPSEVDAVVMHAPGTRKGDLAEIRAVEAVFGKPGPALTSNKWKIGHTLGASGLLSLELALGMIRHRTFIPVPYLSQSEQPGELRFVLVNAVGFGGNAVSILLERP